MDIKTSTGKVLGHIVYESEYDYAHPVIDVLVGGHFSDEHARQTHNISELFEINIDGENKNIYQITFLTEILDKITHLSIKRANLNSIPPIVFSMTNLRYLILDFNNISTIPLYISYLTNLISLSCVNNKINSICPNLADLNELHYIQLDNNPIQTLPVELTKINTNYFKLNTPLLTLDSSFANWKSFNNLTLHSLKYENWITLLCQNPIVFEHPDFPNVWPAKFNISDDNAVMLTSHILIASTEYKQFISKFLKPSQLKHKSNILVSSLKDI